MKVARPNILHTVTMLSIFWFNFDHMMINDQFSGRVEQSVKCVCVCVSKH